MREVRFLGRIRQAKGLTQAELAEKVGVGVNSIARYERNEMTPSLTVGHTIAEVLGVSVDELLRGPAEDVWELRLVFDKEGKGVMDLTQGAASSATLEIGDNGMGITLSGAFPLWEDDEKFEDLISQLRKKRATGLKARKEGWA